MQSMWQLPCVLVAASASLTHADRREKGAHTAFTIHSHSYVTSSKRDNQVHAINAAVAAIARSLSMQSLAVSIIIIVCPMHCIAALDRI